MRYGIPEYKLEKAGAEPATGPDARRGNPFRHRLRGRRGPVRSSELRDQYDAVVLAVGALRARDNDVEGRDLDGRAPGDGAPGARQQGVRGRRPERDLRRGQARGDHRRRRHRRGLPRHRAPAGRDVGDPARLQPGAAANTRDDRCAVADVAAACCAPHRRTPRAVRRRYEVAVQRFIGDEDGNLRAMEIAEVTVERDPQTAAGTIMPVGDSLEMPCDLALLAIGFEGVEHMPLLDGLGLELNRRGALGRAGRTGRPTPRRLRVRGRPPRRIAGGVGHRGGPQRRARGRRLPDGRLGSAGAREADGAAAAWSVDGP